MPIETAASPAVAKLNQVRDEIAKIIHKVYGYSGTTPSRRALTVRSWTEYLANALRK